MANATYLTVSATGNFPVVLDPAIVPFQVSVAVVLGSGASATFEVDYTLDPLNPGPSDPQSPTWFTTAGIPAGSTGNSQAQITTPVTALRLNVSALSGGVLYFKVLQGYKVVTTG